MCCQPSQCCADHSCTQQAGLLPPHRACLPYLRAQLARICKSGTLTTHTNTHLYIVLIIDSTFVCTRLAGSRSDNQHSYPRRDAKMLLSRCSSQTRTSMNLMRISTAQLTHHHLHVDLSQKISNCGCRAPDTHASVHTTCCPFAGRGGGQTQTSCAHTTRRAQAVCTSSANDK